MTNYNSGDMTIIEGQVREIREEEMSAEEKVEAALNNPRLLSEGGYQTVQKVVKQLSAPLEKNTPTTQRRFLFLVDVSPSMDPFSQAVIDSVNTGISGLEGSMEHKTFRVSVVFFNHKFQVIIPFTPLKLKPRLKPGDYVPNGSTALYAGVLAAGKLMADELKPLIAQNYDPRFQCLIISDGDNMTMGKGTADDVRKMIKAMQATERFTFYLLYLGDKPGGGIKVAKDLGIDPDEYLVEIDTTDKAAAEKQFRKMVDAISQQAESL